MPATLPIPGGDDLERADGGSDDRRGPAQGFAHGGGDRPGRRAAGRAQGPRLRWPGREAGRGGGGVARADLGGPGAPAAWATRPPRSSAPPASGARVCSPSPLARAELAAEFLADLRHLDAQLRGTRKKLAAAVRASGTSLTQVFGVGPVIAGTIAGDVGDVARFPGRDHFASCNGTAPVEVSSGNRTIHRLSLRGSRRINHAIHMAAITQLRHKHSEGRACYDKKVAEGKTRKEALRSLKRKVSDAIFARLQADARQAAAARTKGPGGQPGNGSDSSAASSHPERRLFGPATP